MVNDTPSPDASAEPTTDEVGTLTITPEPEAPRPLGLGWHEGDDISALRTAIRCASAKLQNVQQVMSDADLVAFVANLEPQVAYFIAQTAIEVLKMNKENFEQNVAQQRQALDAMTTQVHEVVIPRITKTATA